MQEIILNKSHRDLTSIIVIQNASKRKGKKSHIRQSKYYFKDHILFQTSLKKMISTTYDVAQLLHENRHEMKLKNRYRNFEEMKFSII